MDLKNLTDEQRGLWSRVNALWELSLTRLPEPVRAALHPQYTGWVTGQPEPHDREQAVASVGPSSPRLLNYQLLPLAIVVIEGTVGIAHYRYVAEVEEGLGIGKLVAGCWSEVYLHKNGEWTMVSVSGGPDGQR